MVNTVFLSQFLYPLWVLEARERFVLQFSNHLSTLPLECQAPIFISPRDRATRLCPQAISFLHTISRCTMGLFPTLPHYRRFAAKCLLYSFHCKKCVWKSLTLTPLSSSRHNSWLQIRRSQVRFQALPDFLRRSGSGTGSTQPTETQTPIPQSSNP
jgi:hypothetical protein